MGHARRRRRAELSEYVSPEVLVRLKQYHDRLIAEMQRDPPWSGLDKLDALWPLFVGIGIGIAIEYLADVTIHNTLWVVPLVAPGVLWGIYLIARYFSIYVRHLRAPRTRDEQ